MTMYEYVAADIAEAQSIIEQLVEHEAQVEEARRAKDRHGRNRAERDSKRVRRQLLAQIDPSIAFLYAVGSKQFNSDAFRTEWQSQAMDVRVSDSLRRWHLDGFFANHWDWNDINLLLLSRCSLALTFTFRLAQPYLSKDDDVFYIIDNPVRKDKVFKLPMVAPSSWKGSLRHALWQLGYQDAEPVQRMFGETRDDDTSQSGRLFFYPTFFDRMSLEIINPHDRVRRVGKNPILFESVPIGATGHFTLLYVPFDRIGQDEAETRQQVAEDLILLAQGLQAMFTFYGFGAKTSSGFGLAEDEVDDGRIQTNVLETVQQAAPPEEPAMPEVLRTFLQEFPDEDFSMKPNAWRKQRGATNTQRKQYVEAKSAFQQYHQAREDYEAALAEWEAQVAEPVQSFLEAGFASFSKLVEGTAKDLAAQLTTGGDA